MRVCKRAEVVSFILPHLLRDREEEKHHKLKAWCQSLVVHRLRRGFQVGEVQEHKVSPRRLAQVWGKGGQTRLPQPECWFPHLKRCERWEGQQGDKAPYSTRTRVCSEPTRAHSLLGYVEQTSVGSCLLFFLSLPPSPLVNCSCGQGRAAKSPIMHSSTGSSQDLFLNRKFPVVQQTFLSAFITLLHLFWQILSLG